MNVEGLERIKEHIMDDAKKKANSMMQEKTKEAEEIVQQKKAEAERYKTGRESQISSELKMHEHKNLAKVRLDNKHNYLKTREELIETIVNDVVKNLKRDTSYKNFMKKNLEQNVPLLDAPLTISCAQQDKTLVEGLVKDLKFDAKVIFGSLDAGLILEDKEGKKINVSILAVLEQKKDEIRQAIVSLITKE